MMFGRILRYLSANNLRSLTVLANGQVQISGNKIGIAVQQSYEAESMIENWERNDEQLRVLREALSNHIMAWPRSPDVEIARELLEKYK